MQQLCLMQNPNKQTLDRIRFYSLIVQGPRLMTECLVRPRRNSGSSCWVSRLFLLGESSWPPIINATPEIDVGEWLPWEHQGVQGSHPSWVLS